jgi:YD repeat-containing protein
MSSKKPGVNVSPDAGRWKVQRDGAGRASSRHDTQAEAEAAGRATARREGVEFTLRGRNGQIREKDSYGGDPYPPEG